MATRREADTGANAPTAKFLQARITALSTSCIKRLENVFAAALDEDHSTFNAPPNSNQDSKPPPVLAETAVKHLQLEVESAALVRAAEEFMVLTRTLKELWLFGGLDTIPDDKEQNAEMRRQMEEDEQFVVQGFLEMMAKIDPGKGAVSSEPGESAVPNG